MAAIILALEIFPDKSGDAQPDVEVEFEELEDEIEVECSVFRDGTDRYASTSFTI